MNFKGCYRHPMNRLALGIFIAALVCFGVLQLLPGPAGDRGWTFWGGWLDLISSGAWRYIFVDTGLATGIGSFFGTSLLVVTGPLVVPLLCWSRVIRFLMTFISISVLALFVWSFLSNGSASKLFWGLFATQGFHFVGCLCIRRPLPEEFFPAPHPDA